MVAMDNTETNNTTKIAVGANLDPAVFAVVDQFRAEEDRSMSNMIERLLKSHPRVKPMLEPNTEAVAG